MIEILEAFLMALRAIAWLSVTIAIVVTLGVHFFFPDLHFYFKAVIFLIVLAVVEFTDIPPRKK